MIYLFAIFCVGLAFVTRPLFINLLLDAKVTQENYQGKDIPVGMGLYLFFNLATLWSIGYIIGLYPIQRFFPILLLAGIFSFLGFIDDLLGDRKARGFVGHIGCLLKGRLTTGGLKALGAAVISLVVVYYTTSNAIEAVISWFTLLFLTNFINLLDLRPGRALKVFTVSLLVLFVAFWQLQELWYLAIPLVPLLFFYFPLDLSALAMLGDTGANLLGGILGYFLIQTVGFWGQVIILFGLIITHLYSERYSISTMIEENALLRWLDGLGRRKV